MAADFDYVNLRRSTRVTLTQAKRGVINMTGTQQVFKLWNTPDGLRIMMVRYIYAYNPCEFYFFENRSIL